jgi:FkbM family methyltransferase
MSKGILDLARFLSVHPLTRDNLLDAWVRIASWQVRSRLQAEIVVPWIGGQRLAIVNGMTGATGNIYVGLHDFAEMMLVLHFLREGDLFLDIGSNVGTYTVLASGVRRARTFAFEPDPQTAVRLRRNIEINRLESLVTVHEVALGPAEGEVPFTVGLDTINKVAEPGGAGVRMVEQKRLDTVIGERTPVMMKIDVEGYDDAVLDGAEVVLANRALRVIQIETVTPVTRARLLAHGFQQVHYDPYDRNLKTGPSNVATNNSIFVRDQPFITSRLAAAPSVRILGESI